MTRQRDLTVMAQEVDRDLRAIRAQIRRPLEAAFARGNLTGPQQSLMHALVEKASLSLKELSAHLGLAHSTVSGIVDRLQERGLVERRTSAADRRLSRIVVTRRVRDFLSNTMPRLSIHPLVQALRRASPAERRAIEDGLKALRKVLENS